MYYILTHQKWGEGIRKLDKTTRKMALIYLANSAQKGCSDAIEEIQNLRKDGEILGNVPD